MATPQRRSSGRIARRRDHGTHDNADGPTLWATGQSIQRYANRRSAMANHRCERIFVTLERPVPGLDHLKAVDPVELAWHGSNEDAESIGVTPLEDFCVAAFDGPERYHEKPRWRPAAAGLKTVRAVIALYEKRIADRSDPRGRTPETLGKKVAVLRQLESVLDQADARDIRFYLAVKDLA